MVRMPLFLAIDAGGTKTNCLIADSERVLARASTGSVKLMRVSRAEATLRLHGMLSEAAATAGVSLDQITRTCFGLAGLTIPAVRAWASATIDAQVAGSLILCGDEEIALDAAFSGGSGILVIAGTGSNVIGRAPNGRLVSAGGWGPVLGDEGAGYWIGLESIRAALRACDRDPTEPSATSPEIPGAPSMTASPSWVGSANPGGTPSAALLLEIQRAWNLNSLSELIDLGNHRGDATRPAPDFASLAPIVARLAEQGNPIAAAILNRAGEDLAALVALVARKMPAPPKPIPVAFTGSVLNHITPVRIAMISSLALTLPAAQVHLTAVDPLDGALWRARHT
jgi:N-acetylglucosamine kinase-like BadF-type ATPase